MDRNRTRWIFCFVLLLIAAAGLMMVNVCTGSTAVPPGEAFRALLSMGGGEAAGAAGNTGAAGNAGASGSAGRDTAALIVLNLRVPRLLAAAMLGGALGVSGFLLQTFFANPIAGPFVLGISSGAKLFVALLMIFSLSRGAALSSAGMILAAFAGSMLAMGFILALSGKVRQMSLLVVCGVMIGYLCSAVTDFLVTFASDANIVNLHNWSLGSFSGISWSGVKIIAIVVFPCLILSVLLSKPMSAYQLGEAYAKNLGVDLRHLRLCLILLSSLLSACVTAYAGPVSFVGIAVPHLMRRLFGTERPVLLIPASFLGGAVFCLFCDLLARTLFAPAELSISSVTAVFGAPVVIWMMVGRRKGGGRG